MATNFCLEMHYVPSCFGLNLLDWIALHYIVWYYFVSCCCAVLYRL